MAKHVVGFTWTPYKENYDKDNPELVAKLFDMVKTNIPKSNGFQGLWSGKTLEFPNVQESLCAFASEQDYFDGQSSALNAELQRLKAPLVDTSGPLKEFRNHALMYQPVAPVMDCPIVRVHVVVLPADTDMDAVERECLGVEKALKSGEKKFIGLQAWSFGVAPNLESNYRGFEGTPVRLWTSVLGWESKEAAEAHDKEDAARQEDIKKRYNVLRIDKVWVKFNKLA